MAPAASTLYLLWVSLQRTLGVVCQFPSPCNYHEAFMRCDKCDFSLATTSPVQAMTIFRQRLSSLVLFPQLYSTLMLHLAPRTKLCPLNSHGVLQKGKPTPTTELMNPSCCQLWFNGFYYPVYFHTQNRKSYRGNLIQE